MNTLTQTYDTAQYLLPPAPPELEPGYNVTVHSFNLSMGGAVQYPGVVLDLYPATERAWVQVWRFDHIGWERIGIGIDHLTICDHEIGQCMACERWDWYDNLSEDECRCSACQPGRDLDYEAWLDEDDAAIFWADYMEDERR